MKINKKMIKSIRQRLGIEVTEGTGRTYLKTSDFYVELTDSDILEIFVPLKAIWIYVYNYNCHNYCDYRVY